PLAPIAPPIAASPLAGAVGLLEQRGSGGLSIEELPPSPPPGTGTHVARMEREEEIRQLVQARHDRQLSRGEQPIDVDAEVARLIAIDPEGGPEPELQEAALREEVRQLVIARNER